MSSAVEAEIVPFSAALRDDWLAFFDHAAFADNPGWASCYCFFNHAPHDSEDWQSRRAEENRAAVCGRIERGGLQGYLAYVEGKAVGWCNANVHAAFTTLGETDGDRAQIGVIACFLIAAGYRRRGVARLLLEAACEGFRRRGIPVVEAYALKDAQGEAALHHGPLAMYLAAGFRAVREEGPVLVLRKPLPGPE